MNIFVDLFGYFWWAQKIQQSQLIIFLLSMKNSYPVSFSGFKNFLDWKNVYNLHQFGIQEGKWSEHDGHANKQGDKKVSTLGFKLGT